MLNPRLPIRVGGVALLAIVFTQIFGWSDAVGFGFGWLLLAASLILPRLAQFARRSRRMEWLALTRSASRLAVVARLTALEQRHLHLRLPQVQMWRATGAAKRTPQMEVPNDGS